MAVPIIGGMPKPEAAALIVEPPKLELPPPPSIDRPIDQWGQRELAAAFNHNELCEVSVYIRRKSAPHSVRLDCEAYISKLSLWVERDSVDVTTWNDPRPRRIGIVTACRLEVTGFPRIVEGGA